jgi:hypothetical protein
MLAYSHTLEDMFQRSGFTRQRLLAGTPYLRCQRADIPSTVIPKRVSSSGNKEILPKLRGGREFPRHLKLAVPFA